MKGKRERRGIPRGRKGEPFPIGIPTCFPAASIYFLRRIQALVRKRHTYYRANGETEWK